MRIMTVCLGNICRSPAAEAVLVRRLQQAGLDDVEVVSAGTADYHVGERPHPLTREVGEELGYAFTTVGAQLRPEDLEENDLVLVMDEANLEDARALTRDPDVRAKVRLLGEFAPGADEGGAHEVPDPWGHGRPVFERMYAQIEEAADGVVAAIREGRV